MRTLKFGSFFMACVAVMTLASCTGVVINTSPKQPVVSASAPVKGNTSLTTGANDQMASWTDFQVDDSLTEIGKAIGLQSFYVAKPITISPFNQPMTYVGTYGPSCMVAIGFAQKYSKMRLNQIPEANVLVMSRYNPVTYWTYRESVKTADIKQLLASQADNCR